MEIDRVQAYKWFNLAAAQGHRHAASLREIVAIEMARDQIIQAQRLHWNRAGRNK
jgi:TPR repeat protein